MKQTKKEAYKKEADAFKALLKELKVTSKSKWSEFEQIIQEKFQSELSKKSVKIIKTLENTDYGNKEFVIEDVDGRWIAFGRKEQSQGI